MIADVLETEAFVARPPEFLTPSAFSAKYRYIREGTSPSPGLWSNDVFPYLAPIMDLAAEAIATGRNLVCMKSAQGGGSEALGVNVPGWLLTYYPGPLLYLIAKDELAREFGRDRFSYLCETCPPIARKHLKGRAAGDSIQVKRFVDGKLVLAGGQSVLNLQSQPYRSVVIDEVDSLLDEIAGHGDPVKLAEVRTDAYAEFGATLIVAFAHPSVKERGAGELYYKHSDQRRGFIRCPHCPGSFWLDWTHVKVLPREGQKPDEAARDPASYRFVAPCCGVDLSDGERYAAVQAGVEYRSMLPPEEAKKKKWIGCHFSQLYMRKPIEWLAREWIQGLDEPSIRRVFYNKRLGDVFNEAEQEVTADLWASLIVPEEKPGSWKIGTIPQGVQYLTSGQDSGLRELHWAVWGWGLVEASGSQVMRGWLIDCGVEAGPSALDPSRRSLDAADLHVFDHVLYDRVWSSTDHRIRLGIRQGLHDSGFHPSAAHEYARTKKGRAFPSKGANVDDRSRAPAVRWVQAPTWRVGEKVVTDAAMARADLNTFTLKVDWIGLATQSLAVASGTVTRLSFPHDVPRDFLEHLAGEKLVREAKGRLRWVETGPNHWLDCSIMAFAVARDLAKVSIKAPLRGYRRPTGEDGEALEGYTIGR